MDFETTEFTERTEWNVENFDYVTQVLSVNSVVTPFFQKFFLKENGFRPAGRLMSLEIPTPLW